LNQEFPKLADYVFRADCQNSPLDWTETLYITLDSGPLLKKPKTTNKILNKNETKRKNKEIARI
jgi:hypothetical protein